MYRAKRFRTSVEVYQTSSSSRERGRIGLLADLSTAIDDDQLDVHFQPQLDMATGRIDTVEALLRWHHPRLGPVPPDEFIGLAEQTELIGPLTECVLRRAANELSTLRDQDVKLAVNISARSLQDRHFVASVARVLAETRFPAHRLELEVTERALATETERSRFTIEALRESKIRIAIDDFGTGYSSFITLRDVTADRLKIDRTFITDIQSPPRGPAHREERHRARPRPRTRGRRRRRRDRRTSGGSSAIWAATSPRATASRCRCRSSICGPGSPSARSATRKRSSHDPRVGHEHRRCVGGVHLDPHATPRRARRSVTCG